MAQHRAYLHVATRRARPPASGSHDDHPTHRAAAARGAASRTGRTADRRSRSSLALVGAGLGVLVAAGVLSAQSIGADETDRAGTVELGARSALGSRSALASESTLGTARAANAVSTGLPEQVAPQSAPARTAPDIGVSPAVTAISVATAPGVSADAPAALLGTRDRRERAVSRDAHREAQASAADRRLQAITEKAAVRRTAALAELAARARRQAAVIAANTWQLPVASGAYHLTSRFGECSSLWSQCHTGLDFAAPDGTPVHAVAAGTVKEVGYAGAYGNQTIITTGDGTDLWYCHQSATSVQPGDRVSAGQVIGAVGSTGNTTGPHLHLEVRPRPDDPVDPFPSLVSHSVHP